MDQNHSMLKLDLHNFNNKNIFITGGTGFFGKNILDYLIKQNITPNRVTVLSRNISKFKLTYPELSQIPWLDFEQNDIRALVWNNKPYDYFIHAATSVTEQSSSDILFNEIVIGTEKALSFAKQANVSVFINISSGAVYAQNQQLAPLEESSVLTTDITNRKASYGLGKISAEHLAYTYSQTSAMKVVTLRCFCFAGKYLDDKHFAIGEFIRKALMNERIDIFAGSGVFRSYMSTNNLVKILFKILLLATFHHEKYAVYNIGSEHAINLYDLANLVVQILGSKSQITASNHHHTMVNYYVPDMSKVKRMLDFEDTPLKEIIIELAEYYTKLDKS